MQTEGGGASVGGADGGSAGLAVGVQRRDCWARKVGVGMGWAADGGSAGEKGRRGSRGCGPAEGGGQCKTEGGWYGTPDTKNGRSPMVESTVGALVESGEICDNWAGGPEAKTIHFIKVQCLSSVGSFFVRE